MFKGRYIKGSSLVEYAIPLALVGVVVGVGIYSITTDGGFFKNIMFSSSANVDQQGEKISFGSGTSVDGVFKSSDGKVYVNNNSGQSIRIPLSFEDKYKETITDYLNAGKFDFNNVGVETSGSLGVEDMASARKATTLLYSTLVEVASEGYEGEDQELLSDLSLYGKEIGNIESKLITIKNDMNAKFEPFKIAQQEYKNAKKAYEDAQKKYSNFRLPEDQERLDRLEAEMNKKAIIYSSASEDYKTVSTEFLATTQGYFDNLKQKTGVNFDDVLKKIDASDEISADVKEYVVPVGEKISAIKDSVDVVEKMVNGFNTKFSDIEQAYESFNDVFKSFDVVIDETAGDETFDLLDQEYLNDQQSE